MALAYKRVIIDKNCPWCDQAEETDTYILFACNFARSMWLCFGLKGDLQVGSGETVLDILQHDFEFLSLEKCALIRLVCWILWYRRNKWVWDKVNKSIQGMKNVAMVMLQDWRTAQDVAQQRMQTQSRILPNKWQNHP